MAYALTVILGAIGEWTYDVLGSAVEAALLEAIIAYAWTWPTSTPTTSATDTPVPIPPLAPR